MSDLLTQLQTTSLAWRRTSESAFLFEATALGKHLRLRLNDFPEEPICTLIVDGQETDLQIFPERWTLPRHRGEE